MDAIDWEFMGIPLHPLFVHAAVVLIPLAALMLAVTAVWPAAARKLTFLTPGAGGAAFVFAILAHVSGEWLEPRVDAGAALEQHLDYAEWMNPIAILLLLLSVGLWLWQFYTRKPRRIGAGLKRTVDIAFGVVSVGFAIAAIVAVVLVGDAGARATWGG